MKASVTRELDVVSADDMSPESIACCDTLGEINHPGWRQGVFLEVGFEDRRLHPNPNSED